MQLLVHVAVRRLRALINNRLGSEILNRRRRSCAFATGLTAGPPLKSHRTASRQGSPGSHVGSCWRVATRPEPHARATATATDGARCSPAGWPESRPGDAMDARAGDGENRLESRDLAAGAVPCTVLHAARSARALLLPLPSLPRWARAGRPGIAGPGGWLERYPMYRLIRARPVSARTTPCARGLPPSVNKSGAGRGPWPPPPSCAATHVKCSIIETSRARWTQAGRRGTGGSRTRARVPARCAVRGDADADAGQARAVPCRTRTSARLRHDLAGRQAGRPGRKAGRPARSYGKWR